MLSAIEILTPTIYPVVGARRVRRLGVSKAEEELERSLSKAKAKHEATLANKARALEAYREACRAVKHTEYNVSKIQKKLAAIGGDGND